MVRATGARRMRRRPAAGASTSSAGAAEVEGYWCSVLHIRLLLLLFFFTLLLMCFQAIVVYIYFWIGFCQIWVTLKCKEAFLITVRVIWKAFGSKYSG